MIRLALKNLAIRKRQSCSLAAAAALTLAVIMGALAIGDSMSHSLHERALNRIGQAQFALVGGDRLFRPALADDIESGSSMQVASIFMGVGAASSEDGSRRSNQTNVLGIDANFARFAPAEGFPYGALNRDEGAVVVNEHFANLLSLSIGDEFILRLQEVSELSADAPLAATDKEPVPMRLKVGAIVGAQHFGDFSLYATAEPPKLVYMPRQMLLDALDEAPAANLLLLKGATLEIANDALEEAWQLEDLALELSQIDSGEWEILSRRVFIDHALGNRIQSAIPDAVPVMTYFINRIALGENFTPFSFATGLPPKSAAFLPESLGANEVFINQWTADDLSASVGDTIKLGYFVMDGTKGLVEDGSDFTVAGILPMEGRPVQRAWMPDFPGISNADNCSDWDTSLPINLDLVRDKDEDYWDDFKGAPKVFLPLATAQELWGNRWGKTTAIRIPSDWTQPQIKDTVKEAISPAIIGLQFTPIREQALETSQSTVNFTGLVIGFGFFIIAASLALVSLLFSISINERSQQVGLLLAMGWKRKQVRRLFLWEGFSLSLLGILMGVVPGLLYARMMLEWMDYLWPGGLNVPFHINPVSLLVGLLSGLVLPLFAMLWVVIKQTKALPARLLAGDNFIEASQAKTDTGKGKKAWAIACLVCLLLAAAGMAWAFTMPFNPAAFFGSAFFIVMTGLCAFAWRLRTVAASAQLATHARAIAGREASKATGRSLAIFGTLAAGTFLVFASAAFRKSVSEGYQTDGPTGGFSIMVESLSPIQDELQEVLEPSDTIVGMRVQTGDDASCFSLGKANQPKLMGVKPEAIAEHFSFAAAIPEQQTWQAIFDSGGKTIPAVVDQTTLLWALKMGLGDTITYTDEYGETFTVEIAGALSPGILQGAIIIDEAAFIEKYPSTEGERFFLVQADVDKTIPSIHRFYGEAGAQARSTKDVLADYNAVENAYLFMFQVLGGLGMLLATVGLGLVAARNLQVRRREYALLAAIGWKPHQLRNLARKEVFYVAMPGFLIGVVGAALAVWPQLTAMTQTASLALLALLLVILAVGLYLSVYFAIAWALKNLHNQTLQSE